MSVLAIGCGGGPIDGGTSWTLKTTETSSSTSYWLRQGGSPIESTGPLGSGTSCILAETSSGTATSTSSSETFTVNTALGDTELYHPLVPNGDDFFYYDGHGSATTYSRRCIG